MTTPIAPAPAPVAPPAVAPVAPVAAPVSTTPITPVTPAAPSPSQESVRAPIPPKTPSQTPLLSKRDARNAAAQQAKEFFHREIAPEASGSPATPAPPTSATTPVPVASGTPAPAGELATPFGTPTLIKVPIDSSHPVLGGRSSVKEITVGSPQEEQVLRALINSTGVRKNEVEQAQTRLKELEVERAEMQRKLVERDVFEEARTEWEGTKEYQDALTLYHDILKNHGELAAQNFWRGAQANFQKSARAKFDAKMAEVQAQDLERDGRSWTQSAWDRTQDWLPDVVRTYPGFPQIFERAVISFNDELARGHYPEVVDEDTMHKQFVPLLQARLLSEPGIRESLNRARQDLENRSKAAVQAAADENARVEAIKKQAVEDFVKSQAAGRAANPPNPLGSLAAVSRSAAPAPEPAPSTAPLTGSQARRQARQAGRDLARQRFGV